MFYAEGRKVTIERVDVARDKPQKWRFCRSRSFSEPEAAAEPLAVCPGAPTPMWSDAGQVQTMLRLSKVYARTWPTAAAGLAMTPMTDRKFYVRQALLDVPPELFARRGRWKTTASLSHSISRAGAVPVNWPADGRRRGRSRLPANGHAQGRAAMLRRDAGRCSAIGVGRTHGRTTRCALLKAARMSRPPYRVCVPLRGSDGEA